jgi:hypothetical protein
MDYLINGGEVVAGLVAIVLWWFALRLLGRLRSDKELSVLMFAFVPCVFLQWMVLGVVLILRGTGNM